MNILYSGISIVTNTIPQLFDANVKMNVRSMLNISFINLILHLLIYSAKSKSILKNISVKTGRLAGLMKLSLIIK